MAENRDKGTKPAVGQYQGFDHITFWVGNAMQAADWYVARFGFKHVAYKGLESKPPSRSTVHHVIRLNNITYEFISALNPNDENTVAIGKFLQVHGDSARSVAFAVDDAAGIYHEAVKRGAESVYEPQTLKDEHGTVIISAIKTYGDVHHVFVQRNNYTGAFLPGYQKVDIQDPLYNLSAPIALNFIDHVVSNQPDQQMTPVAEWYERVLQFHRFWSVDDKTMRTEYSALRSVVMADYDEKVKLPINEPAEGKKKSQIQEYVEYYGGPGVQHIAMNTDNIIDTVSRMRERGTKFLEIPDTYWSKLQKRLDAKKAQRSFEITEDLEQLRKLRILVDFDDKGYLLQIFTAPTQNRPTLFYEVIQRRNHQGFGAGNFKALFKAIEDAQAERGNLGDDVGFADGNDNANRVDVY